MKIIKMILIVIALTGCIIFWGCAEKSPIGIKQVEFDDPDNSPPMLNVVAQVGDSVRIAWVDNIMNEEGYRVYRKIEDNSYSLIASVEPDSMEIYDTYNFQDSVKYYYYVETFGPGFEQQSNEHCLLYGYGDIYTGVEGFESGTIPPGWSTGGDADWFVTSNKSYSGDFSVRSGEILKNETSYLQKTFPVPANTEITISFARSVSTNYYDIFKFYVDNNQIETWDSDTYWNTEVYTINTDNKTEITLKWQYTKHSYSTYEDYCAWIDDVQVTWE